MEKEIQKKQIEDMYNVIRDVLKNWWVILFIAISVSMLTCICLDVSSNLYIQHYVCSVSEGIEYRSVCEPESDGEADGYLSIGHEQSDLEEEGIGKPEHGRVSGNGED